MRIATWNINGIKARLEAAVTWLGESGVDVVCLQEIKSVDEGFPAERFGELGYTVFTHGQKGFNGVAILSRLPCEIERRGLPGDETDEQARYIEGVVTGAKGVIRVASIYLPNGNPIDTDKYVYKLAWMRRLEAHARSLLAHEEILALAGDYNVIPEPADARDPDAWRDDALFQPASRQAFRRLLALGLTDAVRSVDAAGGVYTFWDYQAGAWQKDNGIRIDHVLLSPQAADRLMAVTVDRRTRSWEKPSDHVPVIVELDV
ncbi:MAG: exodeoxyribonuclease III [Hyphomicrobiaceae bacterium]